MSLDLIFFKQQNEDVEIKLQLIFLLFNNIILQRFGVVFTMKVIVEMVYI